MPTRIPLPRGVVGRGDQAQKRLRLTNDLRKATENKQFELYYQPIIDLNSGAVAKAEALLKEMRLVE